MYKHLTPMKPFYTPSQVDRIKVAGHFYRRNQLRDKAA